MCSHAPNMARLSMTDTPIHGFKAQGEMPTVSYPVRSPGVLVAAGRRLAAVVVTGTEAVAVHVLLHVQDLAGKQAVRPESGGAPRGRSTLAPRRQWWRNHV